MQFDTVIRIPTLEEEERDSFYGNEYARFSEGEETDNSGSDTLVDLQADHRATLEQSYERDSRWKPHLSWSHLSWKLQQRMEEQAIQRELAWQKIADKLGPLIISSDGGLTFGRGDYTQEGAKERAQERTPFYSQKLSYSNNHSKQLSHHTSNNSSNATTNKLVSTTNSSTPNHHDYKHDKARKRCITVSGILIALIFLLFTLVVLMALGILHR